MMMIQHVDNHFKQLRLNAGLEMNEAAKRINISKSYLYKIEEGNTLPGIKVVLRMQKVYGCTLEDLLRPIAEE